MKTTILSALHLLQGRKPSFLTFNRQIAAELAQRYGQSNQPGKCKGSARRGTLPEVGS